MLLAPIFIVFISVSISTIIFFLYARCYIYVLLILNSWFFTLLLVIEPWKFFKINLNIFCGHLRWLASYSGLSLYLSLFFSSIVIGFVIIILMFLTLVQVLFFVPHMKSYQIIKLINIPVLGLVIFTIISYFIPQQLHVLSSIYLFFTHFGLKTMQFISPVW